VSLDEGALAARVAQVRAEIDGAGARAGRGAGDVELLAAVKYVDASDLPALARAGITIVGENRTDALIAKQAAHEGLFTWDFIGTLQSRKARDLVGRVRLVHSIASLSACEQLHRRASQAVACLVEVNVAGEASKQGLAPDEVEGFLDSIEPLVHVRVEGLMTMPPYAHDPDESRPAFAALRELAARLEASRSGDRHSFGRLSMGTSQDYLAAAEEGATIVRLGSVLYDRPRR
jgi:pyridoxal phosphate enzyme (YggS family)